MEPEQVPTEYSLPKSEAEWKLLCENLYPDLLEQCEMPLKFANDRYLHDFYTRLQEEHQEREDYPKYEYLVKYLGGIEKMWFNSNFSTKVLPPPPGNPELPEFPPISGPESSTRKRETTQSPIGISNRFAVLMKSIEIVDTIQPSRQEKRSAERNRKKNQKLVASGKVGLSPECMNKDQPKKTTLKSVSRLYFMPTDVETIIAPPEPAAIVRPWWITDYNLQLENVVMARFCKTDHLVVVCKCAGGTFSCSLYKLSIAGFTHVHTLEGIDTLPCCVLGGKSWLLLGFKKGDIGAFLYTSRNGWSKENSKIFFKRTISLDIRSVKSCGSAGISVGYIEEKEGALSTTGVLLFELQGACDANKEDKYWLCSRVVDHCKLFHDIADYPKKVISHGTRRGQPRKTFQTGTNTLAFERIEPKDPSPQKVAYNIREFGSAVSAEMFANVIVIHHYDNNIIILDFNHPEPKAVLSPKDVDIPSSCSFYESVAATVERVCVLLPSGHVTFLCLEPPSQANK